MKEYFFACIYYPILQKFATVSGKKDGAGSKFRNSPQNRRENGAVCREKVVSRQRLQARTRDGFYTNRTDVPRREGDRQQEYRFHFSKVLDRCTRSCYNKSARETKPIRRLCPQVLRKNNRCLLDLGSGYFFIATIRPMAKITISIIVV